jgi:hypothetical protein
MAKAKIARWGMTRFDEGYLFLVLGTNRASDLRIGPVWIEPRELDFAAKLIMERVGRELGQKMRRDCNVSRRLRDVLDREAELTKAARAVRRPDVLRLARLRAKYMVAQ